MAKKFKQGQKVKAFDPTHPEKVYNAEVFNFNEKTDLVTLNIPRGRRGDGTMQVTSDCVIPQKKGKK